MSDAELESLKADARLAMRAERALAVSPEAALAVLNTFPPELARLSPVAGYWPVGTEIDPRPLLAMLAKLGCAIALPRMQQRDAPARFLAWRAGEALSADAFGVPSPPTSGTELAPALIIAPLLAFDRKGRRLGQGGGHYDRIIAKHRPLGAIIAGLAYAAQEIETVPVGAHDAPLDWIITEREAIGCAPRDDLRGVTRD
jgi:5-formyltetrahydrofolate cyclo-ligase